MELNQFWNSVKEEIIASLPENVHPWVNSLMPSSFDKGVLTVVTGQRMAMDIIRKNHYHLIVDIIKNVSGINEADFIILFDSNAAKEIKKETEKIQKKIVDANLKAQAMENLSAMQSASNLNLKYKFENFVVGDCNKFAHAVAMAVAKAPAKKYNPLFIYGNSGLGKTHLMQAIGHYTIFHNSKQKVKYTKTEDYVNDFISNSRNSKDTIENMSKFNKKYTNVDIILIDDIQFIESKSKTMAQMQHTFDSLYNKGKQIVITSDRLPKEIPTLTKALCSRFEMGLMVELVSPDIHTRYNIIKNLADNIGLKYTEEALKYVARMFKDNVRELEGAFNKVSAYAEITEQDIDINLVKSVLKCNEEDDEISFENIANVTAQYFDVNVEDLMSSARGQKVSTARHIAVYISREITNKSFVTIAEYFNKKHTTIMFAHDKIKKEISINNDISKAIREIKQALKVI